MSTDIGWYVTQHIDEQKVYAEVAKEVQAGKTVSIHFHHIGEECGDRCVRKP